MSYAFGVIAFSVALIVSVMLHEFGHFATAKRYGMKATRFFVGFGPTLWSTRRGETEYGVKAIPAGGFVKIVGMTPLEELEPGDEDRAFYKQPPGRRVVVLAAGSVIHFIIAVVVLYFVIATTGDPLHSTTTLTIDSTTDCVVADASKPCRATDPVSPAKGKLHAGDEVLAFDGQPLADYDALRQRLQASADKAVTLTVRRDGEVVQVELTPVPVEIDGETVGKVGLLPRIEPAHVGALGAVPKTFTTIGTFFTSTVSALGDLPDQVMTILRGEPRGNGAASVVDIARVSGQIAQAHVSLADRIANLLLIVAQVNFFVGIFNLLPLLPLDGGHIAIVGFEEGRRKLYRRFGRPDPGRVDLLKIMPVTYAVVALFVGLSVILLYAGIVNPIKIQ